MQNVLTIAGRQFRSYFNGPVAYVVICTVLIILGWFFWQPFFLMNRATAREMFIWVHRMLFIAIPAITMGLIAEEKKSGTLELLITMPVRESEVIIGKFLGALGLFAVLLVCTLPYPLSIATLGRIDPGPVMSGYVGLLLEGAAMVAIGLAASSFTDNQIVAFFVSMSIGAFVTFMSFFLPLLPPGVVLNTIEWLTFEPHLESMTRGVLDSRDMIYFASIAGFCLMLAFRALESRRWS